MMYVLDRYGSPIYAGDYVECEIGYPSMDAGQRRRVQAIHEGCIKLRNNTEYGSSVYRPDRFRLAGRYNRKPGAYNTRVDDLDGIPFEKEKVMLHIAVEIGFATMTQMMEAVNKDGIPSRMMADTNASALKERIRARLSQYPTEKWLILSGNTIGERADPPVRFRSI